MTREAVLGVLSLILWALIVVVTLKYVLILLRADNRGEGGTLAADGVGAACAWPGNAGAVVLCGIISAALFYGDAMITPALSVLSAIEGLKVATPAFDPYIVPLTVVILVALFAVQSTRHRQGGSILRSHHASCGSSPSPFAGAHRDRRRSRGASRLQPALWRALSGEPRDDRADHAGRGIPCGDRRRSALRRPRPFRPQADPDRLGRAGAPGACAELSRPGRAGAGRSEGAREPVLPALSRMGAAADGRAGHRCDGDREPGRHHRRLFA